MAENSPSTETNLEFPRKPSLLATYLAGGVGGIIVDCAYFPVDTIKTRMQAAHSNIKFRPVSLLNGIQSTLLGSFPVGFAYIFGYNFSRSKLSNYFPEINEHTLNFLGGICAEICCNLVRSPFEVVKQQMQVGLDTSLKGALTGIYRAKGHKGFYSGLAPMLLRDAPYSAFFMPCYEYMKKLRRQSSTGELSFKDNAINSSVAAIISSFITQPMDVVKTRMMTSRHENFSFRETAKIHYRDYGIKGFFRAYPLRAINAIYYALVFFTVYEESASILDRYISH